MNATEWTPGQPLRADATDDQIEERFTLVYIKSEYGMQVNARFVARELQAATKAATKAEYEANLADQRQDTSRYRLERNYWRAKLVALEAKHEVQPCPLCHLPLEYTALPCNHGAMR